MLKHLRDDIIFSTHRKHEEAKANGGGKLEGRASVEEAEAQASEEEAKEPLSKRKRMDKGMRMYKT